MTAAGIVVRDLTKTYRVARRAPGLLAATRALFHREVDEVSAVRGISFHVEPGEAVGFLGPNGAGKTTTLKMLSGLLHPTSGTVQVRGFVPARRERAFLESVSLVLGQKQQLVWDLPPADTFELNRAIFDVSHADFRARTEPLIELLGVRKVLGTPTRELSLGERMKCELVAALIHGPKVLFLDEPTIGLDVTVRGTVRTFLRDFCRSSGATLLLTSHDMDDVTALCPRIVVIDHGRLTYDGAVGDLVKRVRPEKRVTLHFREPVDATRVEPLGRVLEARPLEVTLAIPDTSIGEAMTRAMATLPVVDLEVSRPPLEDVLSELFVRRETP